MAGPRSEDAPSGRAGQRIDKWLWCARFLKTRSLAAAFVERGLIRIERGGLVQRIDKASALVRPGDRLSLALGGRAIAIEVAALAERRGPASEARGLYLDLSGPPEGATGQTSGDDADYEIAPSPNRRPDRRERRAIVRLKDR